jgi:hypothetical protein
VRHFDFNAFSVIIGGHDDITAYRRRVQDAGEQTLQESLKTLPVPFDHHVRRSVHFDVDPASEAL